MKTRWEGPFIVVKVYPYGVVELKEEESEQSFKVNGHRVKAYLGDDLNRSKEWKSSLYLN